MNKVRRNIFWVLVILFGIAAKPMFAQNFSETPEHKKMWKRFGRKKHRDAFNPNVDSKTHKATHATSKKLAKEDQALLRKQKRAAKKEFRKNGKKLGMKESKVKRK
ncbi:MAG TPA: hypothetical protein VK835_03055 [Bacteroidia bacterium]|jgi:hypothetical protein|nr:hypothetical protein [Bacteroidia bacterium]